MILLRLPTSHGPHIWYCQYLFVDHEVWFDFRGDGDHWALCPKIMEQNNSGREPA
jgi:hypothetical protein